MSLVCSVIFIHHAFNANILDKDYAFSDGEILMVDNAVRTHFEPYERHFKEIGFNENTIKKYLQCTNIQTVTVPVPAKFLRASNVPTGLLNEMIAYLNSEERNHHNFSELLLFSCLSIFAACKGFITLFICNLSNCSKPGRRILISVVIVRTHSVSLIFLCLLRLMASLCRPFLCNGLKTMWVKFSSVSLKALSAVFWGMGIPVVFSRSPARIIWLLKVMETFTNATILSIHSTKLETLINLNSKR